MALKCHGPCLRPILTPARAAYARQVRVAVVCVGVLVTTIAIGSGVAVADTHAIPWRGGWPADRTAGWVADVWCTPEPPSRHLAGPVAVSPSAPLVVVGFTGGRERPDSPRSGVVRLGRTVAAAASFGQDVTVRLYNNAEWEEAGRDVLALVAGSGRRAPPRVVVYGHSLGAGSITRFARQLQAHDLAIDLAVYIDAFGWRNPRVPANVRHAVNFYQRTGLLRGLPLRGKRQLVLESPERTTVLGSYRLTPDTPRFGWKWNLLMPLFYRQHHRLAHDGRIEQLLVSVARPALTGTLAEACAHAAGAPPEVLR